MPPPEPFALVNLRRLLVVRLALLAGLAAAAPLLHPLLGLTVPLGPLTAVIAAWGTVTLASWRYVRRPGAGAAMPVQLAVDIAGLTAVLYLSGGWTNPLVSLYLVPVAVAAVTVSASLTWLLAALATIAYSAIAVYYRPLLPMHGMAGEGFSLHVTGMWLTFVVSAALVAYFGTTMAATLRRRDRALAAAREENLRNEQIMGVATLAAGTAHELSTPLASIALIASELERSAEGEARDDLRSLLAQVNVCRDALGRLREAAEPRDATVPARALLREVCERFELLRPGVPINCELPESLAAHTLPGEETLKQALLNLLDNAADASPHDVALTARRDGGQLEVDILDRGPGFAAAGDGHHRGMGMGMGMGLMLANATIERLGGSVHASPRTGGGSRVRVRLPAAADPEEEA